VGTPFIDILIAQRGWLVKKGAMEARVPEDETPKSRLARLNKIAMATHIQNQRVVPLLPELPSKQKRMAHIYNMLVWISSSPNELNTKQSRFSLSEGLAAGREAVTPEGKIRTGIRTAPPTVRKKGTAALLRKRALRLSPESKTAFYAYRERLYQLMVQGLLQEHDVDEFMKYMKTSQPDGPTVTNMAYPETAAVLPKLIGTELRRNDGFEQLPSASPQEGFKSVPDKNLYVEIGGTRYAFKITDKVDYVDTVRHVYPAMELHGTDLEGFKQWHIKMHSLDDKTLYIDDLYHNTEPGTKFIKGNRLSAKQVFQFGFDMGYMNVVLDDASSIRFVMPQESGPPVNYTGGGKTFQFIDIQSDTPPSTATSVYLRMTMVNAVKHVMLAMRETLRLYVEAANAVQGTDRLPLLLVAETALEEEYVRIQTEGFTPYEDEAILDNGPAAGGAAAAVTPFMITRYTREAEAAAPAASAEAKPDAPHASFFRLKF